MRSVAKSCEVHSAKSDEALVHEQYACQPYPFGVAPTGALPQQLFFTTIAISAHVQVTNQQRGTNRYA